VIVLLKDSGIDILVRMQYTCKFILHFLAVNCNLTTSDYTFFCFVFLSNIIFLCLSCSESGNESSSESEEEGEIKSDDEAEKRLSPIQGEPEEMVEEKVKTPERTGPTEAQLEKMRKQEEKRKAKEAEQERKRKEKEAKQLEKIAKREAKKAEKEAEKTRLKAEAVERKRERVINQQFNIEHNYFARAPDDMDTSYSQKRDEPMSESDGEASDSDATDDADDLPVVDSGEPPAFLMDHFYCSVVTMKRLSGMVHRPQELPVKEASELDIDKIAEQIHDELMAAAADDDKVAKKQHKKLQKEEEKKKTKAELKKEKATEKKRLKDITTSVRSKVNRELAAILEDVVPTKPKSKPKFESRDLDAHNEIMYELFSKGERDFITFLLLA
jgi:hypothetical protein